MAGPIAGLKCSYADDAEVLVVAGMHALRWKKERTIVVTNAARYSAGAFRSGGMSTIGSGRACFATFENASDALRLALSLAHVDARAYVWTGGAWAELVPVEIVGAEARRKSNTRAGLNRFIPKGPEIRIGKG